MNFRISVVVRDLSRCILLIIGIFIVGGNMFFQNARADSDSDKGKDYITIIQTASPYTPKSNVQVDLSLVANTSKDVIDSWKNKGYKVFGFSAIARVGEDYMNGGWTDLKGNVDNGNHNGEIQLNRFGTRFGPHKLHLLPSLKLMEYKKVEAKKFVDSGTEGMVFEEPDIFMNGGYCEQFKKEWKDYYNEEWVPPHSSIESRVKSERLQAYIGYRAYKILSEYCKEYGGKDYKFVLATHSLPNYMLWRVVFDYFNTFSLPTIDIFQSQVWTGTAKTPVLFEGLYQKKLFENAYVDYSYSVSLADALKKEIWLNMDPFEDTEGLAYEFYKSGFESTLIASLMFPTTDKWELLPWPSRIYENDRIAPLYGVELQNVLGMMDDVGKTNSYNWNKEFPRTGVFFSETSMYEMKDPQPSNPQGIFTLSLPLLTMGLPVDIVPLEAVTMKDYLEQFKILFLSYDFCKPLKEEYHKALVSWIKDKGGILVIIGGNNAYNKAPLWWTEQGYNSPVIHLLESLGIANKKSDVVLQKSSDLIYQTDTGYQRIFKKLFDGLKGTDFIPRKMSFICNNNLPELNYLHCAVDPGILEAHFRKSKPSADPNDFRCLEGEGFFTYKFMTKGLKSFKVTVDIACNYIIETSIDDENWQELANSLKRWNKDFKDESNREDVIIDLTPFLAGNPEAVYLRFRDPKAPDCMEWGYGAIVYKMSLEPEYKDSFKLSDTPVPLNLRDSYCIGFTGIKENCSHIIEGKGNLPIIFNSSVGKGEVIVIGAPPTLFGSSKEKSDILREFFKEICSQHSLRFQQDGILHITRGSYHIVKAVASSTTLKGKFIDVLSPNLDVLENPVVAKDNQGIFLQIDTGITEKEPNLFFASHKIKEIKQDNAELKFIVEGPERIPAVARILSPEPSSIKISVQSLKDNNKIEFTNSYDENSKTLFLMFNNYEGGVEVKIAINK